MAVPAARKGDPTAHGVGSGGGASGSTGAALTGAALAGAPGTVVAMTVSGSTDPTPSHGRCQHSGASNAPLIGAAVARPSAMGAASASIGAGSASGKRGAGGPPIVSGSDNVLIGGMPAARAGADTGECDGHSPNKLTSGANGVLVNNYPLARVGDSLSCGSTICDGHPKTLVGTVGGTIDAVRSKFEALPGVRELGAEISEYWEDRNVLAVMGRVREMSEHASMFIGGVKPPFLRSAGTAKVVGQVETKVAETVAPKVNEIPLAQSKISQQHASQIQAVANKIQGNVTVVGSRARGEATAFSDWDYFVEGNAKARSYARWKLPRGVAGGEIGPSGTGSGIDILPLETFDSSVPHVVFRPSGIVGPAK